MRKPVECLYLRMTTIQKNLSDIKQVMTSWAKSPLFIRKDGKKDTVLFLEERSERTKNRYNEIKEVALNIHKYVNQFISVSSS